MAAHLLPGGPALPLPRWSRLVGAAGVVLGGTVAVASAAALGRDLTPSVEPRDGAGLRTTGPYALSRHPLYAGLLLASAGTVLLRARAGTAGAAAALAVVLHLKADAEEQVLARRFGGAWEDYRARVPRLLGLPGR